MKNATFLHYTEYSHHNWADMVGAKEGDWIAVDTDDSEVVKSWSENPGLENVEKELNTIGYTIGIEV